MVDLRHSEVADQGAEEPHCPYIILIMGLCRRHQCDRVLHDQPESASRERTVPSAKMLWRVAFTVQPHPVNT